MTPLRDALMPLYRWVREQYGLDPGPVIVQVGQHRLEIPPLPAMPEPPRLTELQRRILSYVANGPKTLDAIASHLDYDRSTLHRRALKPLMHAGLVENKTGSGYELTPAGEAELE